LDIPTALNLSDKITKSHIVIVNINMLHMKLLTFTINRRKYLHMQGWIATIIRPMAVYIFCTPSECCCTL
jgi:hypothetical protein